MLHCLTWRRWIEIIELDPRIPPSTSSVVTQKVSERRRRRPFTRQTRVHADLDYWRQWPRTPLRGLKYGVTRDYVMGLEVVLATAK
jgi:hypothetical protein